jgi:hypothetical protein
MKKGACRLARPLLLDAGRSRREDNQPLRTTAGAGFSGWAQPAAKPASRATAATLRTSFFMRKILFESS